MENNLNALDMDVVIDGKALRDWLLSDQGLVDYDKCEFGQNVSNTEQYIIYDLGKFKDDPEVLDTTYRNGVDLARVAGVATSYYDEEYDKLSYKSALDGDDYVRIFFGSVVNATITDFIFRFFSIIDGDVYISKECGRVFVKGRAGSDEERIAFAENYNGRIR